jgi:hypothetical protein
MNRLLPLITCLFVGMAAMLLASCTSVPQPLVPPQPMVPLPSAGLAYESGSAAGLHYSYGPPIVVQYGYYGPLPDYYDLAPDQY